MAGLEDGPEWIGKGAFGDVAHFAWLVCGIGGCGGFGGSEWLGGLRRGSGVVGGISSHRGL